MNTKNIMQAAFLGLSYKDNEIDYSLLFNNKLKAVLSLIIKIITRIIRFC
jgi:hypothetical protein